MEAMNRPTPLFNYKKRQRQALVSDPGQVLSAPKSEPPNPSKDKPDTQSSNNTNACSTNSPFHCGGNNAIKSNNSSTINTNMGYNNSLTGGTGSRFSSHNNKPGPGLMDMSGKFVAANRSAGFSSTSRQSNTNSSNATPSLRGRQSSLPHGSRGRGSQFSTANRQGSFIQGRGRGNTNVSTFQRAGPTSDLASGTKSTASNISYGSNSRCLASNASSRFTNQQRFNSNSSSNQHTFSSSFVGESPSWSSSTEVKNSNNHTSKAPHAGQSNRGRGMSNFRGGTNFQAAKTGNGSMDHRNQVSEFEFEEDSIVDTHRQPAQVTRSTNKDVKKPGPDTSMRIFTCPIASLKSWVELKVDSCPIMFEIYGVLDSATVKDQTGTGKEFMLRDDTDCIRCIFYEIDRELPRLTRGQVHRVVGVADRRRGLLKVIHMRAAQKEERAVCQAASKLAQAEMEKLATLSHEQ